MRTIALTQGQFSIVDDDDYEWLSRWKWQAVENGTYRGDKVFYARRSCRVDGRERRFKMHRVILGLSDPAIKVDHINGDALDNRRSNLRPCDDQQNQANSRKQMNYAGTRTSSEYKGVSWDPKQRKWLAQIIVNRRRHYLGRFRVEEDAARAYDLAARAAFGEFARVNF